MAKKTKTHRRIEGIMAANMDEAESRSAEETPAHSPHTVDGERQAESSRGSHAGQRQQAEAAADILVDQASTVDPKPVSRATNAEKAELIIHYAELFCAHMDMKFAALSNRVELLNRQVLETVRRSTCKSLRKFHDFYELWYPKRLQDTADVMHEVELELNECEVIQDWWWGRCVQEPTQSRRLALLATMFEVMRDEMGVLKLYDAIDAVFAGI